MKDNYSIIAISAIISNGVAMIVVHDADSFGSILMFVGVFFGVFLITGIICESICKSYIWVRKKLNKPKIGYDLYFSFLRKNDYIGYKGCVYRICNIERGTESLYLIRPFEDNTSIRDVLLCYNPTYIPGGYISLHQSILMQCDFIIGKYGMKYAYSLAYSEISLEQVKDCYLNGSTYIRK